MNFASVMEVFGAMVAALGGYEFVKWLVHFLTNRKRIERQSEAETSKSETDASASTFHLYVERIEELRNANAELNKQNLEILKDSARKEDLIDDKTAKIRALQDELLESTRKIAALEKSLQHHKNWFCMREYGKGKNECMRREPAQNPPLKYESLHD